MKINYPTNDQIVDTIEYNFNNGESTVVGFKSDTFYVLYNTYVKIKGPDDSVAVASCIEDLIERMETEHAVEVY